MRTPKGGGYEKDNSVFKDSNFNTIWFMHYLIGRWNSFFGLEFN